MKKLLSLILCGAMLLTLTACDSKGNSSDNSIVQNFDPVPVPEGGWTMEALAKTICINGKAISNPLTIDSLGEGYSFVEDPYPYLQYNGEKIALIRFENDSTNNDNIMKKVFMISVSNGLDNPTDISINGITFGSTQAEAELALGKPSVEEVSGDTLTWIFFEEGKDEDSNFLVLWIEDGKISYFAFRFR